MNCYYLPGLKNKARTLYTYGAISTWLPKCIPDKVQIEMANLLLNYEGKDNDNKLKEIIDNTMSVLNDKDCILIPKDGFGRISNPNPPVKEEDPCDGCPTGELENKIINLKKKYKELKVPDLMTFNVPEEDKRPVYNPKEFNFNTDVDPCEGCGNKISKAENKISGLQIQLEKLKTKVEYTCNNCEFCHPFNGGAGLLLLDKDNKVVFHSKINSLYFIKENEFKGSSGERQTKIQLRLPKRIPQELSQRRRWLIKVTGEFEEFTNTYDILASRQAGGKFSFIKNKSNVIGLYINADYNGPEQLRGKLYFGDKMNDSDIEGISDSFRISNY